MPANNFNLGCNFPLMFQLSKLFGKCRLRGQNHEAFARLSDQLMGRLWFAYLADWQRPFLLVHCNFLLQIFTLTYRREWTGNKGTKVLDLGLKVRHSWWKWLKEWWKVSGFWESSSRTLGVLLELSSIWWQKGRQDHQGGSDGLHNEAVVLTRLGQSPLPVFREFVFVGPWCVGHHLFKSLLTSPAPGHSARWGARPRRPAQIPEWESPAGSLYISSDQKPPKTTWMHENSMLTGLR